MEDERYCAAVRTGVNLKRLEGAAPMDAQGILLDQNVPQSRRMAYIFKKIGNPNRFTVGDVEVMLEFPDDAPPLQHVLTAYLRRKLGG